MIIKKKIVKQPQTLEELEDVQTYDVSTESGQSSVAENFNPEKEIDLFDLDNIDFTQRQERRRGNRRRGFRRVDDRNLISRAREEAEGIREAAAKEGYQEGIAKAASDMEFFRNSIKGFLNAKQEVFEYIAPDILEISIDIAQKIIKKEITQDPQAILDKITEILKTLSKEEAKINIRVNPLQVGAVKGGIPDIISDAGLDARIIIIPDETVTEGGCVVTTANGVIDATIESQISIIREALKEI